MKLVFFERLENGNDEYIKILRKNFPKNFHLRGTKIVLDCANGAGYKAAPKLLKELGFNLDDRPGSDLDLVKAQLLNYNIDNFSKSDNV